MNSLHILVAGGCHVTGYPLGRAYSFVNTLATELAGDGLNTSIDTLSPLAMSHPERVAARCVSATPDILLLQVGNWESTPCVAATLRRGLGLPSRPSSNSSPTPADPAAGHLQPGPLWYASIACKRALDTVLAHPFVDLDRAARTADKFFTAIEALRIPSVFVISPLPSIDPTVMHYRRAFGRVMESQTRRCSFPYLDLLAPDSQPVPRALPLFVDNMHLSAAGHRLLGAWVARNLISHIEVVA